MPFMSALPNELWMSVFEFLNSPADLARVLRASKRFRDLAIRILHRQLIWTDPRHFAQGLHLWANNPGMVTVPRTLIVGITEAQTHFVQVDRQEHTVVVGMDGIPDSELSISTGPLMIFDRLEPQETEPSSIIPSFVACHELYQAMTTRIMTFSQLTKLTFRNAILPANIYEILHSIPSLRILHIEFCSFDTATIEGDWDHTTLPLRELSILGLEDNRAINLTMAHDLRFLRFDSAAYIFKLFARPNRRRIIPESLESIELHLPEKKYWPASQQEAQQRYIIPLVAFLAICPNVVHLSINNHSPEFTVPDHILPNLRSYKGPMSTVVTMAGNRAIDQLDIHDTGSKISDFIDTLTQVGEHHSSLQELSAHVLDWDDEVLYAVTQLFPNLRKLDIRYDVGSPTEDEILSIGPHFVARAPHMHTVHIFSTRHRSAAELLVPRQHNELPDFDTKEYCDPEAELKGLVKCWDRYCPQLQEVQLLEGFVWRRGNVRPGKKSTGWEKRPYQLVDGERDFGC